MSNTYQQGIPGDGDEHASHAMVQQNFGAVAQNYVTSKVHTNSLDLEWLKEAAALTGKELVVDVATGAGHTALTLAPYAAQVVAVDITQPMLTAAQQLAATRQITNIRFVEADAQALPLASNSYDLVTCRHAPHHFATVSQAVHEWTRVLKPGGKLLLEDPISPEEAELDTFLNMIEALRDPSHVRNYRISEWLSLLSAASLRVTVSHVWNIPLDIPSWTQRMQTPPASVEKIERYLHDASPAIRERFHIGPNEEGLLSFWLPAAIFVGVKA